ncbi:family 78 glycoside hydrolase catalytic domain [Pedobacter sp. WC2423]|uniref:family 78 glycoside hydrolase catalytic domain n=1 Tax=Pedobacter sp. WC2423 TaxID=3234142 RepID=UPI003466B8FC
MIYIKTLFRNRYLKGLLFLIIVQVFVLRAQGEPTNFGVDHLICEYKMNPISIDVLKPRLCWKLTGAKRNIRQTAYEIQVFTEKESANTLKAPLWSSGKIFSDQSVQVPYNGPALKSKQAYFWRVMVWNSEGESSTWSKVNCWRMGILNAREWKAKWIQSNFKNDTTGSPSSQFRKDFKLNRPVKEAYLYITSHGVYEGWLNGERIGNDYFTPGWTSYNNRIQYQTYDVTSQLKNGLNAIGVTLGDGWYRGYTYDKKKDIYGKELALLVQLEVEYKDGTRGTFISDGTWKTSQGPIHSSSFFDGEVYDARMEKIGWSTVGYNDKAWKQVLVNSSIKDNLVSMAGPPVRKHEKFVPLKVLTTPQGDRVIDFGQNLVGWVKFKLAGKSGDTLKLYHAEVLDQKGNFYTQNLRSAKQEISYVFKGGAEETYEPHFTFQGFRYVKVKGYTGVLDSTSIVAYAIYSDMPQTGTFSTSNPLINQLQHNIVWGQKGNFVDVPTDCPQRDERMGWTGDAQAFCRTATFNMDVAGFYGKWLKDLAADQHKDGAVPYVIPTVQDSSAVAATGWADAATIVPWNVYLAYGDKRILEQQYPSMKGWVDYMVRHSKDYLWSTGTHFGDWLSYAGTDYEDGAAVTDKGLIAQTFFAHSTQLLINSAEILGKVEDERKYSILLNHLKSAFQKEYVTPSGRIASGTQTAYVLALNFDMLPEELRQSAADRLRRNIDNYDEHLTTGFLGTPYLNHVLTRFGHLDMAYRLLIKETYPSWLYPVKNGATTIWERWDGIKVDGSFEDPGMNSFNHYAYGAIGDWMYRVVAGINTSETATGFKEMVISPKPGANLTTAQAELETLYGKVSSKWMIDGKKLKIDIVIPPNTTAKIELPNVAGKVLENGNDIYSVKDLHEIKKVGDTQQMSVGSGNYHFEYTFHF